MFVEFVDSIRGTMAGRWKYLPSRTKVNGKGEEENRDERKRPWKRGRKDRVSGLDGEQRQEDGRRSRRLSEGEGNKTETERRQEKEKEKEKEKRKRKKERIVPLYLLVLKRSNLCQEPDGSR